MDESKKRKLAVEETAKSKPIKRPARAARNKTSIRHNQEMNPNLPVPVEGKGERDSGEVMDESKKRKLAVDETADEYASTPESEESLRSLLDPLRKDQLVDILAKLGIQYPTIAEEIRGVARSDPVHRKLFVRGLAWETTSETLCAAFRVHGEIEEGAVVVDKATGKSRGYGFITYRNMESTRKALQEPSKLIDGRLAVCNLACEGLSSTSISTDVTLRKLYIGGLPPDISSETLLTFFSRHGEIEEGSVAYDKETNKSRGFGFVTYKTAEASKKAIEDPNKSLGGRNITVKLADSHKVKVMQPQLPTTVVPLAISLPAGYAQPAKQQVMATAAVGYAPYPQALAGYPSGYPNAPAQFSAPPHVSYTQIGARDHVGFPLAAPGGVPSYPYYVTKP